MIPAPNQREAGFTLLEVLAALVVLGFIVAGLSQGLQFGLGATARQERRSAQRGDIEAVDRLLRRVVTHLDPGTGRDPNLLVGDGNQMILASDLGDGGPGAGLAAIGLAVDGRALVLTWQPVRHVIPLAPQPAPRRIVLMTGLERLEVSYFGQTGTEPPAWHRSWTQKIPPLLVRMRLVFTPDTGQRWPDIVAGPARPRPAQ